MTATIAAKYSPNNILYRGEAQGFEHAMQLVQSQCEKEMALNRQYAVEMPDLNTSELDKNLVSFKAASAKCLAEWQAKVMSAAKELATEWANSDDPDVKMIGEAVLGDDYSGLAI